VRGLRATGRWLQRIPRGRAWIPALAWFGLISALSSLPAAPGGTLGFASLVLNLGHAPLFGVLALLLALSLPRERGWPVLGRREVVLLLFATLLLGTLDELHQHLWSIARDPSLFDVATDVTGAACVLWIASYVRGAASDGGLSLRLGAGLLLCVLAAALATWDATLFFVLALLPTLLLAWCAASLFRSRGSKRPWSAVQCALGWQSLWVLPALAGHVVLVVVRHGFNLLEIPFALVFGWWVLLGGASVQAVFEETAKDLTGHRRDTLLDNAHVYLAFTAVQALALGLLLAPRLRAHRARGTGAGALVRDPVLLLAGLAVLANAALGIAWPWWGS